MNNVSRKCRNFVSHCAQIGLMRTYWNTTHGLHAINNWQPNCWVQVTCPSQDDVQYLSEELNIPDYFLSDIADTDERARYEYEDGWIMVILRIPYYHDEGGNASRTPFTTVPLGIIMKKEIVITVCNFETHMMLDFVSYQQKRNLGFTDSVDMTFRLFLSSAVWYLKRIKQIGLMIDRAKQHLHRSVDNADLLSLSRIQDSLTYFMTSIRGNETLLSKLKFKLPVDELDADMIEDVNIEMSQAREMTSIYNSILDSTMDTYANIINNNMAGVMKMLTSLSFIMMVPTLVASLFGMNLVNGMENAWWGFPFAIILSIGLTAGSWGLFKLRKWL